VPIARGGDAFQAAGIRAVGLSFLALVAAVVLAWPSLVAAATIAVGAVYGAELAIADSPLDAAAPAVAAGLLLAAELGYWSIEERGRWQGQAGDSLRRSALVALVAVAAALVATLLLSVVDAVRTGGLAIDLAGAAAAAGVLVAVLLLARGQSSSGS
jgi:VCBS repeat-containing protein